MKTQYNKSITGSIEVLQEVLSQPKPVGSRELSRILKEEHTRVSRILGTLFKEGFLSKTEKKKYYAGPGIHVLAAQAIHNSSLLRIALPELRKLKDDRHTVALAVLWKDSICYLVHSRPHQTLEEGIGSHEIYPARKSSLGIMLMAKNFPRGGKFNYELENEDKIKEAEANGYARLDYKGGTVSLAVPICDPPIAAIGSSINRPSRKELQDTLKLLRKIKVDIERKILDEERHRDKC
ncbi:MAG TPA: hypothetical protein DET40_05750 [Lentisphaeria bacterium]|nr:MAG: hypothetical protein A2X45_12490 [Lentisphaerae bacterium GWF2_50_93]HCE43031.1 hypothetical protein [Lentisphaeria bacterium]